MLFLVVFTRKTNKNKMACFAIEELKGLLCLNKVDLHKAFSYEY